MRKTLLKKKENQLQEIDKIAKMLVKRDLKLTETIAELERQKSELDRIAKLLVRRDLELAETREKLSNQLQEIDKIAKMLVRRDLKLTELREKREKELEKLKRIDEKRIVSLIREKALREDIERKVQELEKTRNALLNILEDFQEAKEKAEAEKNKTQAIINNFTDGLLVFNLQKRLTLINPQAEIFFNLKKENLIGKKISQLKKFPPFASLFQLIGQEKIKKIFRKELLLREDLILEVSTVPLLREKEKLGHFVILHDITREKRIERLKTEFVSIAAHQLRTPLSAIKWTLKMLLEGDLGPLNKEQIGFLEKCYQSNERMIRLINDLLNVTRIEEGRLLYKLELANLEEICKEVISSLEEKIKIKKIKFGFLKPPKKLPLVKVDIEKIKLVMTNLIDNAIKYTLPGGSVIVSLKKKEKEIEFEVKDSGVGIPKDQQKRVFTKFFRGSNILKMETTGTGLGLFIAKNIIEAHKGKIWFESEEGKGSCFHFSLPLK